MTALLESIEEREGARRNSIVVVMSIYRKPKLSFFFKSSLVKLSSIFRPVLKSKVTIVLW